MNCSVYVCMCVCVCVSCVCLVCVCVCVFVYLCMYLCVIVRTHRRMGVYAGMKFVFFRFVGVGVCAHVCTQVHKQTRAPKQCVGEL